MKNLVILGSTGSIGTQTLDVVSKNSSDFKVIGLSAGKNIELFREQLKIFKPKAACVKDESDMLNLKKDFPGIDFYYGKEGLINLASKYLETDLVVNALMGMRGLEPTYYAINAGFDIALANKETLVAGGEIIMKLAKEKNVKILPIDSEHSAIFQCLEGNGGAYSITHEVSDFRKIKKILLTCSGGPFRGYDLEKLSHVKLSDALKHPKWNMGKKITIDSATLMNKGLEVIEAKWLFNVDPENIEVLIHPQSIVHSGVMFMDNSVITQMGVPDMRIPISLALGYPNRIESRERELDFFSEGSNLTFFKPDMETFKCLKLALDAIKKGGSYPVVLNAANEVLVEKFLNSEIEFIDIQNELERVLASHIPSFNLSLNDVLRIDAETRDLFK